MDMHLGLALICRQRHLKNGILVLGTITQTKTLPSITKGGLWMIKSKTRKTSKPLFQSPKPRHINITILTIRLMSICSLFHFLIYLDFYIAMF